MRHHLPQKVLQSKGGSHKDTLLCTPLLWDTPLQKNIFYPHFALILLVFGLEVARVNFLNLKQHLPILTSFWRNFTVFVVT